MMRYPLGVMFHNSMDMSRSDTEITNVCEFKLPRSLSSLTDIGRLLKSRFECTHLLLATVYTSNM